MGLRPRPTPSPRLEGSAFQPGEGRRRLRAWPESQRLSAEQAAEPRKVVQGGSLIRTSLVCPGTFKRPRGAIVLWLTVRNLRT